ncbi:hypothetical protein PIB30_001596 [Stylosanthes scabra]|uniref:Uncharacterized protein n=1 Tax=Stylosanthes scabra TaxID=79078 RepID=A0ABU6S2A4_9FABA|nr:hypothetical protein [Stylosanthes scabra]
MLVEAHSNVYVLNELVNEDGPKDVDLRVDLSGSCGSYPFPPGFGPIHETDMGQGQGEIIRVATENRIGGKRERRKEYVQWRKESDERVGVINVTAAELVAGEAVQGDAEEAKKSYYDKNTASDRNNTISDALLNCDVTMVLKTGPAGSTGRTANWSSMRFGFT